MTIRRIARGPARSPGRPGVLDDLVRDLARSAVAGGHRHEVERAAAAAVELVELDATRASSWHTLGVCRGYLEGPDGAGFAWPTPPTAALADVELVGRLHATVERGHARRLEELVTSDLDAVERAAGAPAVAPIAHHIAEAVLGTVPGRLPAVLRALSTCPTQWRALVDTVRDRAGELTAPQHQRLGEHLLAALEERLRAWAGAEEPASAPLLGAGADVRVARASFRRGRGDFTGARALLEGVDLDLVTPYRKADALVEQALAGAGVADLLTVCAPASNHERQALVSALSGYAGDLERAVAAAPRHPVANLLLGLLEMAGGDDASAAHRFWVAESAAHHAAGAVWERLVPCLRFHRGLATLRLLEPGTDRVAAGDVLHALDTGYRPLADDLVNAIDALDAHGSASAPTVLHRAVGLHERDERLLQRLVHHAEGGHELAVATARRLGVGGAAGYGLRFRLLGAALAGALGTARRDAARELVRDVEDLLEAACDPGLDEGWASRLAHDDLLRSALGGHRGRGGSGPSPAARRAGRRGRRGAPGAGGAPSRSPRSLRSP